MKKRKNLRVPQKISELEKMAGGRPVNPEHPLYQLSHRIPWSDFETEYAEKFSENFGAPAINCGCMKTNRRGLTIEL